MSILLQISIPVSETAASSGSRFSIMDLMISGGWILIPLVILLVITFYIIIIRSIEIRKADKDPDRFMEKIRSMVYSGDVTGAILQCQQFDTPFSRMIERGLTRLGRSLAVIEASIENAGKLEVHKLEKNLNLLATISGAAPMLGFLGTAIGIAKAFRALSGQSGTISPGLLTSGMFDAMVATIGGLAVGLVAYMGYNYLVNRIDRIIHKMEYSSMEFMELLQQPK